MASTTITSSKIIEDIDQEIADLQAKRSRLVQQHPRIND
ncbi:hypothetical protein [Klebsiella pneumoniae]